MKSRAMWEEINCSYWQKETWSVGLRMVKPAAAPQIGDTHGCGVVLNTRFRSPLWSLQIVALGKTYTQKWQQ